VSVGALFEQAKAKMTVKEVFQRTRSVYATACPIGKAMAQKSFSMRASERSHDWTVAQGRLPRLSTGVVEAAITLR
jgi:hypothetical protein